ncbi:MAG: hypothetical protein IPF50_10235 [Proteobacteria bacterium]|nr:hypothetical protein [Pseudomonadota bacterium]
MRRSVSAAISTRAASNWAGAWTFALQPRVILAQRYQILLQLSGDGLSWFFSRNRRCSVTDQCVELERFSSS